MTQRSPTFMALLALMMPSGIVSAQTVFYLESGGLVMIETETDNIPQGWTLDTAIEDYSGTGYLEWMGPNYFQKANAGNGVIKYDFQIFTPGNYELRWRSRIARGESSTEHNDSWVRLATGENVPEEHAIDGWTKVYMNRRDHWSWDANTVDFDPMPIRQNFEVGNHTVEISGRSAGHAIDRIALQRYEDVSLNEFEFNLTPVSQTSTESFDPETRNGGACDNPDESVGTDGDFENSSDENACTDTDPTDETETNSGPETDAEVPEPTAEQATLAKQLEEHPVGVCLDNRLVLGAEKDTYISNGRYWDTNELQISGTHSRSLLFFNIERMPAVNSAELHYSLVENRTGSGTLYAYLASHSNWPEDGLALTTPDDMLLLGEEGNYWVSGKRYSMTLTPTLLPAEQFTIALQMASDSESLYLASSESPAGMPFLIVEGDEDFCSAYKISHGSDNQIPTPDTPDSSETPTRNLLTIEAEDVEQTGTSSSTGAMGATTFSLLLLTLIRRKLIPLRQLLR